MNIENYEPCEKGLDYYKSKSDFKTAWKDCHRGDWMLWIANEMKVDHRKLTLAKALCAKTVLHLMQDERSKKAVEVAESYGRGLVSKDELVASSDASSAAYAASSAAAAAADAAYDAADVADASSAADAAENKNMMATADICREILTEEVFSKINQGEGI